MADTEYNPALHEIKGVLGRLEPMIIRIDERLNATLPHLATKAELATAVAGLTASLAEKPSKGFLLALIALLTALYALFLGGLAALPALRTLFGG
jgi:hypothetical protein